MNATFEIYAKWIPPMQAWFEARHPKAPGDSDGVYRAAIRAKALDTLRGTAAGRDAVERRDVRHRARRTRRCCCACARIRSPRRAPTADAMLEELRKVIPAFLTRVDQPDRGGRWSAYLADTRARTAEIAARLTAGVAASPADEVTLVDFDPDGEAKVVAAALYSVVGAAGRGAAGDRAAMSPAEREEVLRAYVGERSNRRHKPGRAFERTSYRFDVLTDYGAFRDLQRHRLLTIDWQALSPRHGYIAAGGDRRGRRRRGLAAT